MARDLVAAEKMVEAAEARLAEAKTALNQIKQTDLPDLMDELDVQEFRLGDGTVIRVEEKIRASIPKASKEAAVAWLVANGHEKIIKLQVVAEFGKDSARQASKALAALDGVDEIKLVKQTRDVNAQTLAAFAREQLREGVQLPTALLGILRQRFASVKPPRG
jgi:hypothetical protein